MKHKTHHLYYLFYPRNWIIIALLLYGATVSAQETPAGEDKFYIGTEFQNETLTNLIFYPPFYESGMNTILQRADSSTLELIGDYNILAANSQHKEDWIHHYTTGYYSKWEAENQTDEERVGVKHKWGQQADWRDTVACWSTKDLLEPKNSIIYGPHYRQDKRYKRWLYGSANKDSVKYVPRFHMALDNPYGVNSEEDVCKIMVVFRYRIDDTHYADTFKVRTLEVGDFNTEGNFDDFYLHPDPISAWYMYPEQFWLPMDIQQNVNAPSILEYIDWESYTGIQYCVDWLRSDTLCTLYIDYIEVYDNDGWNEYIETPGLVTTRIQDYAASFNNQTWQNIKHWVGVDEPYSIDCYTPIRIVDSLIQTVNPGKPLIVAFNPMWWHDYKINGEDEMEMFNNRENLDKKYFNYLPKDIIRKK